MNEKSVNSNPTDTEFQIQIIETLLAEYGDGTGTISIETAKSVEYLALRGLGVSKGGWNAAKAALRIASQQADN